MIRENLTRIRKKIAETARSCGRNHEEITLLAVSKRMDAAKIEEARQCGQQHFGENFVQEAGEKIVQSDPSLIWHFIGHLQSNKAKTAARLFQVIETVDRLKIALALNKYATEFNRVLDILIQVNTGLEKQKSGVTPQKAERLLRELGTLDHLRIRGLMTMPPYSADPEHSRPYFRQLKELAEQFRTKELFADNANVALSMGMSNDFPVAIEEGATLIRVGTAIFGERM